MKLNITPKINNYNLKSDKVAPFKMVNIINKDFDKYCYEVFLIRTTYSLNDNGFIINLLKDDSFTHEEYKIILENDHFDIYAKSNEGIINAFTTIYQMIKMDELYIGEIHDAPRYSYRGIQIDPCRHFFKMDEVKKIIEAASIVKINKLHMHLSDDQGFRMEIKCMPSLAKKSIDYYTQDEMAELIEYCRIRGVEVIPEFDMPGHMSALVSAYKEYSCLNEDIIIPTKGGIYPHILCAGKETVYKMVENMLSEVAKIFPSKLLHLGGDEAYKKNWRVCPDCTNKMKELGLSNVDDLQGYFMNRVQSISNKLGKQVIYWDDALTASNLDKGYITQFWSLARAKELQSYMKNGGKLIFSDVFQFYFDYPTSMTPLKKVYERELHISKMDVTDMIEGLECTHWSERIETNEHLEEMCFPRSIAMAEKAWTVNLDYDDFISRLDAIKNILNVKFIDSKLYNPKGNLRHKETISYLDLCSKTNEPLSDESFGASISYEFVKEYFKFFTLRDIPYVIKSLKK